MQILGDCGWGVVMLRKLYAKVRETENAVAPPRHVIILKYANYIRLVLAGNCHVLLVGLIRHSKAKQK